MRSKVRNLTSSSTVRTISGLAGGNLFALAIGVVGSLVQARYVSPTDLGYFRGFSIVTGYAFFFHLGFLDAFYRLYPYYIGSDEKKRAEAMAEICQSWMIVVSTIVSGAFVVLATVSLASGNWRAFLGWIVQAVTMTSIIYGGYLGATYRTGHDFSTVAKASVISSIVNLFILPFFVFWPYVTLALRSGLGSLVNLIYLHVRRPLKLKWRFNWREWVDLLKHGFPIFIGSYGSMTLWSLTESSLVLWYLGTHALGLWSMSIMLADIAIKIPQAITAVYSPRVIEHYAKTKSISSVIDLCKKPLVLGTVGMMVFVGCSSFLIPYIVPVIMPKYIQAIPIMSIIMGFTLCIILDLPYVLLVAMGKLRQQIIIVYVSLILFIITALYSIGLGYGLMGLIIASLVGRAVKIVLTYVFIYINYLDQKLHFMEV